MHESVTPRVTKRAVWIGIGLIGAVLIVGWLVFQPQKQAELAEIPLGIVQSVSAAYSERGRVKTISGIETNATTTISSSVEEFVRKRRYQYLQGGVVRSNSLIYQRGNQYSAIEQTSSLFIGPIQLLRHQRNAVPFITDFAPYAFWTTRRLEKFEGQASEGFPLRQGATLTAKSRYSTIYATGDLQDSLATTQQCLVKELAQANTLLASLTGLAASVECTERFDQKNAMQVDVAEWAYLADYGLWLQVRYSYEVQYPAINQTHRVIHSHTLTRIELVDVELIQNSARTK